MITYRIGQGGRYLWEKIVHAFSVLGIDPNLLTAVGFGINMLAAYLFAYGYFRWAGLIVIVAAIFDLTDGPVARVTKRVTPFGGFLDSVVDRYSDLLLLVGLLV